MVFSFNANCTFEAENVDDALLKVAQHFGALQKDQIDPEFLLLSGTLSLEPIE